MIDLANCDPAAKEAGPEFDVLVAVKRMGWPPYSALNKVRCVAGAYAIGADGEPFSPSTNPAHAGEARRKAGWSNVHHENGGVVVVIGIDGRTGHGSCAYSETNGDKGEAEALATCRAIAAAMKAET